MLTPVIFVMGVSGSGKSTIARALAARFSIPFLDGDAFHSVDNRRKMAAGIALDDEDRWPWLDALGAAIAAENSAGHGVVAACSALKRAYRDRLRRAVGRPVSFLYLSIERDTLEQRVQSRQDHFMPVSLLDSQLETLEAPTSDETDVIAIASTDVDATLMRALHAMANR